MNNDLISRERLKNTILLGNYDTQSKILSAIDNAPTVDIKDELAGAYNEGYMCGSREAEKARPQGEWICHSDSYITFYTCNRCNGFGYKDDKFCNNCGADMQKGGAE